MAWRSILRRERRRGVGISGRGVGNLLARQQVLKPPILRLLAVLEDSYGQLLQVSLKHLALVDDLLGGGKTVLFKIALADQEDVPNKEQYDQTAESGQDKELNSIHGNGWVRTCKTG